NGRSGKDTWRCKECHGWDYKGVDGAYGSGSHKTGFTGVFQLSGDANAALAALKGETNPDHDFSSVMDEQALTDLALFIGSELYDDAEIVNYDDKSAIGGDAANGEALFGDNCADCHGPQGLAINFHDEAEPEYAPTIARDNPWEFLNKARFGQPGEEDMPVGLDIGFTNQDLADILAYLQTVPATSPVAEGGRLYDNWMKAIGADAPATEMPLWATQDSNTRSGADTWRCKECHGWDYKGADGVYSSGSHMTGFPGIFDASAMSAEEIISWLDGTANADHDFSSYLNEDQFNMFVAFIQEGMIDKGDYINADKTVSGDAGHGQELYESVCSTCHGDDGTEIDFHEGTDEPPEYVGSVAADNPWEFHNKASFGQPGEHMPSGLNLGWSLQDILDVTSHAQSLPGE
ncbi:MAG: c-type cytochrome, partial [Anaerolineales bacterium]